MSEKTFQNGTVKWFDPAKGYGFILPDAGGEEIFVHVHGLADGAKAVSANDRVEFQIQTTARGDRAANVRKINSSSPANPTHTK